MASEFPSKHKAHSLAEMKPGDAGIIENYQDDLASVPLMELGFLPGAMVRMYSIAPFGDPLTFELGGAMMSLRKTDAANVLLKQRTP